MLFEESTEMSCSNTQSIRKHLNAIIVKCAIFDKSERAPLSSVNLSKLARTARSLAGSEDTVESQPLLPLPQRDKK